MLKCACSVENLLRMRIIRSVAHQRRERQPRPCSWHPWVSSALNKFEVNREGKSLFLRREQCSASFEFLGSDWSIVLCEKMPLLWQYSLFTNGIARLEVESIIGSIQAIENDFYWHCLHPVMESIAEVKWTKQLVFSRSMRIGYFPFFRGSWFSWAVIASALVLAWTAFWLLANITFFLSAGLLQNTSSKNRKEGTHRSW